VLFYFAIWSALSWADFVLYHYFGDFFSVIKTYRIPLSFWSCLALVAMGASTHPQLQDLPVKLFRKILQVLNIKTLGKVMGFLAQI
jgi:hypothetical protein